jgi:hypothetical protein
MADKNVSFAKDYTLKNPNDEVKISVQIGDANDEGSGYHIFLGTKRITSNKEAKLGKASSLIGKTALISATIPDVLKETNWTSITITIHEGTSEKILGTYKEQASKHLDTVGYTIKINFKS